MAPVRSEAVGLSKWLAAHSRTEKLEKPGISEKARKTTFCTCSVLICRLMAIFLHLLLRCSAFRSLPLGTFRLTSSKRNTSTLAGFGYAAFFFFCWGRTTHSADGSKASKDRFCDVEDGNNPASVLASTSVGLFTLASMLSALFDNSSTCILIQKLQVNVVFVDRPHIRSMPTQFNVRMISLYSVLLKYSQAHSCTWHVQVQASIWCLATGLLDVYATMYVCMYVCT